MLEKNADMDQEQVESILTSTALPIPAGSMSVFDFIPDGSGMDYFTYSWGDDATGSGLIQADLALDAVF
jgi:hypothetical protein